MKIAFALVICFFALIASAQKPEQGKKIASSAKSKSASCEGDKVKFCADESGDGLGRCLQDHREELSDSCKIDLKATSSKKP